MDHLDDAESTLHDAGHEEIADQLRNEKLPTGVFEDTWTYEELYLTLFSHGVDSAGIADADRWRSVLDRAERRGEFLGVDPTEFPVDFGSYVRYNAEFPDTISARQPLLSPLPIERFEQFARRAPVSVRGENECRVVLSALHSAGVLNTFRQSVHQASR